MKQTPAKWIEPDWSLPGRVRALTTTVAAGNLATHTGEDPQRVRANRDALRAESTIPSEPRWLTQVHGPLVLNADDVDESVEADGSWTSTRGVVCGVLTADCLPVLFTDRRGSIVAAAHAGWRGLVSGVLDLTVQRFLELDIPPDALRVWLGPAIGPAAYEVDENVRDTFLQRDPGCAGCFTQTSPGHWQLDLYEAARTILAAQGVLAISGGDYCTYRDSRFYSYRKDPECGRQATLIWIDEAAPDLPPEPTPGRRHDD